MEFDPKFNIGQKITLRALVTRKKPEGIPVEVFVVDIIYRHADKTIRYDVDHLDEEMQNNWGGYTNVLECNLF